MKTLKNTTIIAGIIVALFSLTAHAAEKTGKEKTAAEKKVIVESMGINKALEYTLIENYLEEQIAQEIMEFSQQEKMIKIYNDKDELVFEGKPDSEEAILLQISADFLMEYDQVSYFILQN